MNVGKSPSRDRDTGEDGEREDRAGVEDQLAEGTGRDLVKTAFTRKFLKLSARRFMRDKIRLWNNLSPFKAKAQDLLLKKVRRNFDGNRPWRIKSGS